MKASRTTFEENVAGVVCLGAVVRNFTGKPIAAMSVSLPIQRFRGENPITLKEHLIEAVNRLSTELGYNPSNDASPVARRPAPPLKPLSNAYPTVFTRVPLPAIEIRISSP